jgi:hypothetical protein
MVLGAEFFATEGFRRYLEFEDFFVFRNFFAETFFGIFRAALGFVFFAIAILLDI